MLSSDTIRISGRGLRLISRSGFYLHTSRVEAELGMRWHTWDQMVCDMVDQQLELVSWLITLSLPNPNNN